MSENQKKNTHLLGIGSILRDLRKSLGYTLQQVSEETGIADETIRRIEVSKFEPKLSTLEILSDYYRLDLIELIARKRVHDSIFSEDLISKVNDVLNQHDLAEVRRFAESILKDSEFVDTNHNSNIAKFLYSLKYIKYDPINGQNDTISILEDVLLNISPDYLNEKKLSFSFPFEMSIILLLSTIYRQNNDYEKAISLLQVSILRIKKMPLINDRFSDYLASSYLNLAYTYHSMGENENVIKIVNDCFNNDKVNYTKTAIAYLLFRKGLALFLLKDSIGEAILITSMSLMDIKTKEHLQKHLSVQYNLNLKI